MNVDSKVKICAIELQEGAGLNQCWTVKYIGYTTRDENTFLSEFKTRMGKNLSFSKKVDNLKDPKTKIRVRYLGAAFLSSADEKVNKFIHQYDTINNGWNTVER